MKVILLQDVKKVGQKGSVATVADGYANNVLIPKKLAAPATPQNLLKWEREQEGKKERQAAEAAAAKQLLSVIDGKTVTMKVRANDAGGLFEAIHPKDIVAEIRKQYSIEIPVEAISFDPIKKTGTYSGNIALRGASAKISISVEKL